MLLLNPGPVTLTERVRRSLLQPDLCHRESEFFDLQDAIRTGLLGTYGLNAADWSAVLLTGSGTAAVEAMMAALVPDNGRVLIVENGVYGERIAQICAQHRIANERICGDWMKAPDIDAISARLDAASGKERFTQVAIVHHETTTGRLNDLGSLGRVCLARGASLLVDGVSSFGAEALDFATGSIGAVAGTANKCLHGVPGISFVIVRRAALAQAASRAYYLDLVRLARLQDQRNTPFTPGVHAYYALLEALHEHSEAGGRVARHRHYLQLAEQVRAGLAAFGIEPAIPAAQSSVVLRAYGLPARLTYGALHDALKACGFVIYAGQGDLAKTLFRISTMGNIHSADIAHLLKCFAQLC
jgi:2-aminoethylphosphonate-pyruvate transaminase